MAEVCQFIDSRPGCANWLIYAGDTEGEIFEFLADGVPIDTSGWVLSAQARETAAAPAVALTAICTAVDAAIGQWRVKWDGEAVRTLLAGAESWRGVWDLQAVTPGGDTRTLVRGSLTIELDVTRDA